MNTAPGFTSLEPTQTSILWATNISCTHRVKKGKEVRLLPEKGGNIWCRGGWRRGQGKRLSNTNIL